MVLDPTGRLAGRGAYLCSDGSCWRIALDKNILSRALQVPLPDDLRSHLEAGARAMNTTTTQGGASGQE
jgi:uncharacterized protein